MKKRLGLMLAATAICAAAPALAHDRDDNDGSYAQYFGGYQNFDELYQHDYAGIRHGLSDGSFTPRRARHFLTELRDIRQQEAYYRSRDGYLDPREGREIQRRLEMLHDVMHQAHEEGHAAQDDWGGYGRGDDRYGAPYDPRR